MTDTRTAATGTVPAPRQADSGERVSTETLNSIATADRVQTRLGTMEFTDGVPSAQTVQQVYDNLDFTRAVDAFLLAFQGASLQALRNGFRAVGCADNQFMLFSGLMDSNSLFLTGNADTVYIWGFLDLHDGPMVIEVPPGSLGCIDDMWFRWVTDFGLPGPDRGTGGTYVVLPPDYDGPEPQGGVFVVRSRTFSVTVVGRCFLDHDDPAPPVATIRDSLKVYPYTPGGHGTSIASFLAGKTPLTGLTERTPATFVEGTGRAMNTIVPNDATFYDLLNDLVQEEPAAALDPEIAGHLAAIGILKGSPFEPDDRMRRILGEAVAAGNATARTIALRPRKDEGFYYYADTPTWFNPLFRGGYEFQTPPPRITPDGVEPFPDTGARMLNSRIAMLWIATGVTPAMCMRLTGVGSQYLLAGFDSAGEPFDGAQTYRLTLPPDIPAARFWSLTLYDNQTRSMLQTAQRFPRAGSQGYPTPAATANPDGSTTITIGPERPEEVAEGNWIQTAPGKGWFTLLRLYSPLQPFFDQTWRPSEFDRVD